MIGSVFMQNRAFQVCIAYAMIYAHFAIYELPHILPIVFILAFGFQSIDMIISTITLLKKPTKFISSIISPYLWHIKYNTDFSFQYSLLKYWYVDYLLWLPLAILTYSAGFIITTYVLLLFVVLVSIFSLVIDTVVKNNIEYLHG